MATVQASGPFLRLLDSTRHSDFEIECKGNSFRVHKAVIAAKSDFSDRLCNSNFTEGQNNKVTLDDEDPALLCRLIKFIYGDSYPSHSISDDAPGHGKFRTVNDRCVFKFDNSVTGKQIYRFDTITCSLHFSSDPRNIKQIDWARRALIHVMMYVLGDKYDVSGLKAYSSRQFLASFCHLDENVFDNIDRLQLTIDELPRQHYSLTAARVRHHIVKYIYDKTPDHWTELRDVILWDFEFAENRKTIYDPSGSHLSPEGIRAFPKLAAVCSTIILSERSWKCSHCHLDAEMLTDSCDCGLLDFCSKGACLQKITNRSICFKCLRFGPLGFVGDPRD